MKEKFLNSTICFLEKYNSYSEKDIKKLRYGLEGIYLTITKMIIILLLAFILGIFKEVVILIILFNIIRYFGFGFHAEKSSECLFVSIINFVLIPYVFSKLTFSMNISLIIAGFCIINYLVFAPADTVKRPLYNKKKRIIRKILTILVGVLYTIAMVYFDNNYVTALILNALIVQAIVISPITYKLFRQPYNNYKKLEQAIIQ